MADTIATTLKDKAAKTWQRLKLIDKNEAPNSVIQLIGFLLIAIGVIFLLVKLIEPRATAISHLEGAHVAIAFFIISLGISFAFPDLLQDPTGGLSTMRIAVFMMINVICMLLLKIGWGAESFTDIGINGYWVGIIAFVFGSKATQSFFESRMAVVPPPSVGGVSQQTTTGPATTPTPAGDDLTRQAIVQNQADLKAKFPNILSLSDTINRSNGAMVHVVAIYVKDGNVAGIPATLPATINGTQYNVNTEVVSNVGVAKRLGGQVNSEISAQDSQDYKGSICCYVKSTTDNAFNGVVTSGHIYTGGYQINYHGRLNPRDQKKVFINDQAVGNWFLQVMDETQDLAVARLDSPPNLDGYRSFAAGYHQVINDDVQTAKPNVTLLSHNNTITDAFILDYNAPFPMPTGNGDINMQNIIFVGSSNVRDDSTSITDGGDSGGCIFHKDTGELIGMVMGSTSKFTFVLALQQTLEKYNLKPI